MSVPVLSGGDFRKPIICLKVCRIFLTSLDIFVVGIIICVMI